MKKMAPVSDEVCIARISRFMVVCSALLLMVPTILRFALMPSLVTFVWSLLALGVAVRVSQISLAVSHDVVTITNFFKTTEIPVWEAEVELGDAEGGGMVSDFGGRLDEGGRLLYVKRQWNNGELVHVGVAPRYGEDALRIRAELETEIRKARAA